MLGGDNSDADDQEDANEDHNPYRLDDSKEGSAGLGASIALTNAKKRKISKNGMITSHSSKHYSVVDGNNKAVKRAKEELTTQATGASAGKAGHSGSGMFGSVFNTKSIMEVDRAMKSAQHKNSRAKRG